MPFSSSFVRCWGQGSKMPLASCRHKNKHMTIHLCKCCEWELRVAKRDLSGGIHLSQEVMDDFPK